MILIHDGYMIDPKSGREGNYDILIDGDKIVKIAEKIEPTRLSLAVSPECPALPLATEDRGCARCGT